MKNTKISLMLLATLLAVQTTAHAKDMVEQPEDKPARTWGQFLDQHKYKIGAGVAVAGAGAVGAYLYSDEIAQFLQLSPAEKKQSIAQDLQSIKQQQADVEMQAAELQGMTEIKKHTAKEQKVIAEKEADLAVKEQAVAQAEEKVAVKQSWLQSIGDFLGSRNSWKGSGPIQDELDANNAAWLAEHPDEAFAASFDRSKILPENEHEKQLNAAQQKAERAEDKWHEAGDELLINLSKNIFSLNPSRADRKAWKDSDRKTKDARDDFYDADDDLMDAKEHLNKQYEAELKKKNDPRADSIDPLFQRQDARKYLQQGYTSPELRPYMEEINAHYNQSNKQ